MQIKKKFGIFFIINLAKKRKIKKKKKIKEKKKHIQKKI